MSSENTEKDMTEASVAASPLAKLAGSDAGTRLRARYRAERRFRLYGICSIAIALVFLAVLLGSIVLQGYSAFVQTRIALPIAFNAETIDPDGNRDRAALSSA